MILSPCSNVTVSPLTVIVDPAAFVEYTKLFGCIGCIGSSNDTSPSVQCTTVKAASLFQSVPKVIASHCSIVPLKLKSVNLEQFSNAYSPILVTFSGMVIEAKDEQSWNEYSPILVTLFGILIDVNDVHMPKTKPLILVIPSGMLIYTKEQQPLNALLSIDVTPSGMVIDVIEERANALSPILVTVSGMFTEAKYGQELNALLSILVTVFGICMYVNAVLPVALTLVISLG